MQYSSFTIEEIELQGFNGFWLNDVKHFKMTVKEAVTLILGRNGCGKSRLLSQLNPLALPKNEYQPNGFKKIRVRADNDVYLLESILKGSTLKCTITNVSSGETLCDNANPSVYNKLVFDLFGYDKDLHDLFTGRIRLTRMKGPERKKWFSRLSESDLTYALKFYKNACTTDRDVAGGIKSLKYTIGELRPKVLDSEDELQATRERVELIQKDITTIDDVLRELPTNDKITEQSIVDAEKQLGKLCSEVQDLYVWMPESLSTVDPEAIKGQIGRLAGRGDGLLTNIQNLQDRIGKAIKINSVDSAAIKHDIDEKRVLVEQLEKQIHAFPALVNFSVSELRSVEDSGGDTIDAIKAALKVTTETVNIKTISQLVEQGKSKCLQLSAAINRIGADIRSVDERLKYIADACDVTCNNCTHTFKPGVAENEVTQLRERRGDLIASLEETKRALDSADESQGVMVNWERTLRSASEAIRTGRSNQALALLFDSLNDDKAWCDTGARYIGRVEVFESEVVIAGRVARINEVIESLSREYALAVASQAEDLGSLKQMLSAALHEKDSCIAQRQELSNLLGRYDDALKRIRRAEELEALLIAAADRYEYSEITAVANVKAELLTEHKSELWDMLTVTRQRLQEMERQKQQLEMQEEQLADLERRRIATQQIVKGMGLNGGVLAKYLYQCVQRVTDLMTDYLDRIWGYDMKVLPCDVSDGEMDYKFPFWIKNTSNVSEDVSEASEGQRDAFDFVFMLAAYKAMGMQRYPLFIDENLSAFDEGHRDEAISFLKDLIAKGHHSQEFMVSHDAETHFKLVHADVVILDSEGITVPGEYNKHVTIN